MSMNCPKCRAEVSGEARFCSTCGAPLQSASPDQAATEIVKDPLLGVVLSGKYQIQSHLGSGGMSAVYRANRLHIGDTIALKVLLPHLAKDASLAERFRLEARSAARVQHPHVVTIYDYSEAVGDQPAFIAMELVPGRSLRQTLEAEGRLDLPRAGRLMKAICAGLNAAHKSDVLHRDMKPENVMVIAPDDEDESETVKVMDFGIARLRDQAIALTQTGAQIGTAYYMSPEQWRGGHDIDQRADIYSLGVMFYEMLTGARPFRAETRDRMMYEHLVAEPPPLPQELICCPALDGVVRQALEKEPSLRWSDALSFARAVREAIAETIAKPSRGLTGELKLESLPHLATASAPTEISPSLVFQTVRLDHTGQVVGNTELQVPARTEQLPGGSTLEMLWLPGGAFMMGSPETEAGRWANEGPRHEELLKPFYLGRFPVTQAQWRAVAQLPPARLPLKPEPFYFKGDDALPAEYISWPEAEEFCARLTQATGRKYRLPSEAEWEYACRGGTQTPFSFGETVTPEFVNYDGEYPYGQAAAQLTRGRPTPAGALGVANSFGFYDMHGNVWEWCRDVWYDSYDAITGDGRARGVTGAVDGRPRVCRGGSWLNLARYCRSAARCHYNAGVHGSQIGFRVAAEAED